MTLGEQAETLKQKVDAFLRQVRFDDDEGIRPLVTWGKDLEFGIPAIDDEHKRLMELANRVYTMVKTVDDPKVLMAAFTELRSMPPGISPMRKLSWPASITRMPPSTGHQHQLFIERLDALPRITAREHRSGVSM